MRGLWVEELEQRFLQIIIVKVVQRLGGDFVEGCFFA